MPTPSPDHLMSQASQHHAAGQLHEAEALYRAVLAQAPERIDARCGLGVLASQTDRHQEAVELLKWETVMRSGSVLLMVALGASLLATGNRELATVCLRKALEIDPACPEAHNTLGCALLEQGRLVDAVVAFKAALKYRPAYAEACYNLARTLASAELPEDAITMYRMAVRLWPGYAKALLNLGFLLREKGDLDAAAESFRRAMAARTGYSEAMHNLAVTIAEQGQATQGVAWLRRAVGTDPANYHAHSALVYLMQFDPECANGAQLAAEAVKWHQRHAAALMPAAQEWPHVRDAQRPLRIGYVSPDFRAHAECRFMLPLLEQHDRGQFEVHCYSSVRKPDAITARMQELAGVWHEVRDLSDEQLAAQIQQDQIDVLIDLTMHMQDHRLQVFARKPAPVQITWLAYPAGTGLAAMDYRVTDAFLDPPGAPDAGYPERPLRLPDAWFCYQAAADAPDVTPLPASTSEWLTFGSMNSFRKVSEPVLALWSQVFQAAQTASGKRTRLVMICPEGQYRKDVLVFLQRQGVEADRVELLAPMKYAQYLATCQRLDVALDPFPHAGATTTCDALWMGVPTLSLRGATAAGRLGDSVLATAGLAEWVAATPEEYVAKAIALTGDLQALAALRAGLRQKVAHSPLCDAARFTRHFEAAIRAAWRAWCGQAAV